MGLTQKLGTIPLAILTDASNNVGIGAAPSGSYKLEVTGTGRFSGNLLTNGYALIGTTSSTGVGASRLQITGATAQLLVSNTTSSGHIALYSTGVDAYITKNTASGIMYFGLAPQDGSSFTSQMAITNAGNVGIGTSSPTVLLSVGASQASPVSTADVTLGLNRFIMWGTSGSGASTVRSWGIANNELVAGDFVIKSSSTNNNTLDTVRLQITSAGDVIIGTTPTANGHNFFMASGGGAYQSIGHPNGTSTGYSYTIYYYNSTSIGGVSQSGTTAVVYNTTSDYRLKENVTPIANAIDKIMQVKPVSYKWKNTEDEYGEGFLAHELQQIIPLAVTGEKDALHEDGSFKLQQVDYSKLVPYLTKAVQEQNQIIQELSQQNQELKERLDKAGL